MNNIILRGLKIGLFLFLIINKSTAQEVTVKFGPLFTNLKEIEQNGSGGEESRLTEDEDYFYSRFFKESCFITCREIAIRKRRKKDGEIVWTNVLSYQGNYTNEFVGLTKTKSGFVLFMQNLNSKQKKYSLYGIKMGENLDIVTDSVLIIQADVPKHQSLNQEFKFRVKRINDHLLIYGGFTDGTHIDRQFKSLDLDLNVVWEKELPIFQVKPSWSTKRFTSLIELTPTNDLIVVLRDTLYQFLSTPKQTIITSIKSDTIEKYSQSKQFYYDSSANTIAIIDYYDNNIMCKDCVGGIFIATYDLKSMTYSFKTTPLTKEFIDKFMETEGAYEKKKFPEGLALADWYKNEDGELILIFEEWHSYGGSTSSSSMKYYTEKGFVVCLSKEDKIRWHSIVRLSGMTSTSPYNVGVNSIYFQENLYLFYYEGRNVTIEEEGLKKKKETYEYGIVAKIVDKEGKQLPENWFPIPKNQKRLSYTRSGDKMMGSNRILLSFENGGQISSSALIEAILEVK